MGAADRQDFPGIKGPPSCQANQRSPRQEAMPMTSKQLWKLFLQTGRPELYCLAQRRARQEQRQTRERGGDHAP